MPKRLDIDYQVLSPRVNYTDPIVRHDPRIQPTTVSVLNNSTRATEQTADGSSNLPDDKKTVDAIRIPLIRINTFVIDPTEVIYMKINYDGFVPTLYLAVSQASHNYQEMDVIGMENTITVVMSPYVDGAYKSVSIDFYVTNVDYSGNTIRFNATYKHIGLEVHHTEQVTFNPYPSNGCQATYCMLPTNRYPTTFEFLHRIAVNELGLGFATTDHVKEIKDNKSRILSNVTYYKAMLDAIKEGGLDQDSIFDGWIDLYRYLVVVNVSWLFQEDVYYYDLGFHPEVGVQVTDDISPSPVQSDMTYRVISNIEIDVDFDNNMLFDHYKWEVNNSDLYMNGTISKYIIGEPSSNGGSNAVNETDVTIVEDKLDSRYKNSQYYFTKQEYLGYEYGNVDDNNTPTLLQSKIHDNWFRKKRARRLRVTMKYANFGLQRGTFIVLIVGQTDPGLKDRLVRRKDSVDEINGEEYIPSHYQENNILMNQGAQVVDYIISGMYYIDGMEFEYDKDTERIIQHLLLIKKGPFSQAYGKTISPIMEP